MGNAEVKPLRKNPRLPKNRRPQKEPGGKSGCRKKTGFDGGRETKWTPVRSVGAGRPVRKPPGSFRSAASRAPCGNEAEQDDARYVSLYFAELVWFQFPAQRRSHERGGLLKEVLRRMGSWILRARTDPRRRRRRAGGGPGGFCPSRHRGAAQQTEY